MSGTVKVEMNPIGQILKEKGLSSNGSVQSFHTNNVLRRIIKYMPFKTGFTIKSTIAQTDLNKPAIVTDQPYAKYLYHGKVMVGIAPKQLTDTPLNYSHHKNPLAGPYWDRLLIAAEKPAIVADLQRYIKRRSSR